MLEAAVNLAQCPHGFVDDGSCYASGFLDVIFDYAAGRYDTARTAS